MTLYRCPGCTSGGCWACENMVPVEFDPDAATKEYLRIVGVTEGVYHPRTAHMIRRVAMQRAFLAGTGQPLPPLFPPGDPGEWCQSCWEAYPPTHDCEEPPDGCQCRGHS